MKSKGSVIQQIRALKRSIKKFDPGYKNSKLKALKELESIKSN